MGNYNDFDLDIKKVQASDATPNAVTAVCTPIVDASIKYCTYSVQYCTVLTAAFSCNGGCTAKTCAEADSCHASCGGLVTSCGGHCR